MVSMLSSGKEERGRSSSIFKNTCTNLDLTNFVYNLRYFVRVTVARRLADIIRERDMWVNSYRMPVEVNNSIKMEVGIEDCLHIEFEYNKSK